MEQQFWQDKWNANEIGFHQDTSHPLLEKHFPNLALEKNARIFVPLCGKSSDMICLQEMGHEVVGLELSEIAVKAFYKENNIFVSINDAGAFKRFLSAHIEILCGDFFSVAPELLGNISAVFDRASLIAMPTEMRVKYVDKMRQITHSGIEILLIALEYEQDMISPPPFAVTQDEVKTLYSSWCEIELLEKAASEVKGKPCNELVYRLKVK